jgi:hypothetical protein
MLYKTQLAGAGIFDKNQLHIFGGLNLPAVKTQAVSLDSGAWSDGWPLHHKPMQGHCVLQVIRSGPQDRKLKYKYYK